MHKLTIIFSKTNLLWLITTLLVVFFVFLKVGPIVNFGNGMLEMFAGKVIKKCANETYRPACYDNEIPKFVDRNILSMEQAFAMNSIIQKSDKEYLYCHILGHNLADSETRKNPDKWLEVITRCPTLACNNGCEHGAIMRRFKGSEVLSASQIEEIIPELKRACEPRGKWDPTELERSMCYHSIGHLGLYITGADIEKSLEICSKVGIKEDGRSYYQTCVSGVFMLIFQSLDKDDEALVVNVKPPKEKVNEFCSKYSGVENTACRTESWPYFFDEFTEPGGLTKFCSFTQDSYYRNWCFDTGLRGNLTLRLLQKDGISGVAKYCLGLPGDIKARCFASVANSWVQDEPNYIADSIALCVEADKYGYADECYKGLLYFSKFSFNYGSDLWRSYCTNFPENHKQKNYRQMCLKGETPEGW